MARGKKKPPSERHESVTVPGAARPERFDRSYMAGLAMAYCLMSEVPQAVALAFVDILCAHRVLDVGICGGGRSRQVVVGSVSVIVGGIGPPLPARICPHSVRAIRARVH
jgi:hypothetical protein